MCFGWAHVVKKTIPTGGEVSVAQLDIGLPAVQSLGLEGFFSFFDPF